MPKKGVVPPQLRRFLFKKGHRVRKALKQARRRVRVKGKVRMARRRRGARARGRRRRSIFPPVMQLLHLAPTATAVMGDPNGNFNARGEATAGAFARFKEGGIGPAVTEFVDVLGINYLGYKPSDGSGWGLPVKTYTFHAIVWALSKVLRKVGVNRFTSKFGVRIA